MGNRRLLGRQRKRKVSESKRVSGQKHDSFQLMSYRSGLFLSLQFSFPVLLLAVEISESLHVKLRSSTHCVLQKTSYLPELNIVELLFVLSFS